MDLAAPRPRPSLARCALCHDQAAGEVLRCPGCATLTHPACADEVGGACPTLGCAHAARQERRRARRRALPGGFVGWWTRNRLLVMANTVVWTLVGLVGGASAFAFLALLLRDA